MTQPAPRYALSVWQPWAWLLLNGADIHNRPWPLPWRMRGQRVVIHACRRGIGRSFREWEAAKRIADKCGVALPTPGALVYGAGIGTVVFSGHVQCSPSYWFRGLYGWQVVDPEPWAAPVYIDGDLGFWPWKEAIHGR